MIGWVKLHRSIQNNWIFTDAERFRAWIIILLKVNYEKKIELIQGELITCNRGQSTLSLKSWALIFGDKWTIQKVRTFFKLLEKDKMILIEGLRKTTRLTVCNYESYQDEQHADNTQVTQRQHTANTQLTTIKEDKEDKEEEEGKEKRASKKNYRKFNHLSLSIEEFEKIKSEGYTKDQIDSILDSIENYKLNKNYNSLNLTARKWLKKEYPNIKTKQETKEVVYKWDWLGHPEQRGTKAQYEACIKSWEGSGVEINLIEPKHD